MSIEGYPLAWEWMLFVAALAVVSVGCLMPAGWLPTLPNDKLLHFVAFAGLTILAAPLAPDWARLWRWLLGLALAGLAIELLQKLVPGRSFCWRDLGANLAGIGTASVVILLERAI